jgi:hypothetical protein
MNNKTAKLLSKFALLMDRPKKEVKKNWDLLPWLERRKTRKQIQFLLRKNRQHVKQLIGNVKITKEKNRERFLKLIKASSYQKGKKRAGAFGAIAALLGMIGGLFHAKS